MRSSEKIVSLYPRGRSVGELVWREVLAVQRLRAKNVKNKGEKGRREARSLKEVGFVSG